MKKIETPFWIAPQGVKREKNCHFEAEKSFSIEVVPDAYSLQIAAESYYLLEINGICAGRSSARGNRVLNFADTYEIAPFLHSGENRIKVHVLCMNIVTDCAVPAEPALWVRGETFETDLSWRCALCRKEYPADVPLYTSLSGFAEWRDLRFTEERAELPTVQVPIPKELFLRESPLPQEKIFLPVGIAAAALVPACDIQDKDVARLSTFEKHIPLPTTPFEPLCRKGKHDLLIAAPDLDGGVTVVLDFGREITGRIEVELTASSGTVADFAYEEALYQGDRLRADHTATNPEYHFAERSILRTGRQVIGGRLQERGFRLIQLTLRHFTGDVILHRITAVDRRYPFGEAAAFSCSDPRWNRLFDVAKETLNCCITDTFTDCPWRERLFYTNDLVVENRIALELFSDPRLHRHAFKLCFSEADADGFVPSFSPGHELTVPPGLKISVILSANLTMPQVLYDYYLHTGDVETIREYYPALKKIMASFQTYLNADGIIEPPEIWNFFDWSYEMNGSAFSHTRTSLLNHFYIMALALMQKLADAIGEPCDHREEISRLLVATEKAFYDAKANRVADAAGGIASPEILAALGVPPGAKRQSPFSRVAHALALLAGGDKRFLAGLLDETLLAPDLFYGFFMLQAMMKYHLDREAFNYVEKYWMPMIDSGTPTLWEAGVYHPGKEAFGGSASLCHGFSTSPVDFIQKRLLGVEPLTPGFSTFRFSPFTETLVCAEGTIPTPRGLIRVHWKKRGETIAAKLFVPPETKAVTPAGEFSPGEYEIIF